MAKEVLNNANDLVISRIELEKYMKEMMDTNPKIKFDTAILD